MVTYAPPLRDMEFIWAELLSAPAKLASFPAFTEIDAGLMRSVVAEAGRFASGVLFPLNGSGDREGCHFDHGMVRTPKGFADAYRQFVVAGWPALACAAEDGGQGLPNLLNCMLFEMTCAANHAWTMYPGLLHGAYVCIREHADEALKRRYLPKLASGEWLATMCLTEPQAGSDLGLLTTKAEPRPDGSFRVTGNKIFISGGEQDISENIVHLVLARLPDAPPGSKGISLFLVPKILSQGDVLGEHNAVHCLGIEHKMGIRGSATCAMEFSGATGWLIGQENRGLQAMFVMMNAARLHVGAQGVGIAEAAYQQALAYARERVQMKAVTRPESRRHMAADPIITHPAVSRLLMNQRARTEGGRMLLYWTALMLDTAEHHAESAVRHEADELVSLITPVVKAMLTEQAFISTHQALQVFGGHGFICETGIEQYLRDVRVTLIYEGTNEIQAIDLLVRKVMGDSGRRLGQFLAQVASDVASAQQGCIAGAASALSDLVASVGQLTKDITVRAAAEPELPYRIAPEYLRLLGHCAQAWLWLKAAAIAHAGHAQDPEFYGEKIATAGYYFNFVLPEVHQHAAVISRATTTSVTSPNPAAAT